MFSVQKQMLSAQRKEIRWMLVGLGIAMIGCALFILSNRLDGPARIVGYSIGFIVAFSGLIVAGAHLYRWKRIRDFLRSEAAAIKSKENRELCEKCQDEPGNTYTFLYGRRATTVLTATPTFTQTSTSIQLKGSDSALVCDHCISKNRLQRVVLYGIASMILVTVTVWSFLASKGGPLDSPEIPDFIILVGIIGALFTLSMFLGFLGEVTASKNERGEEIAISIRKKRLQQRGYNYFTTQRAWESTKAQEKMRNQ
jgi:hypothetical protein